MNNQNPIQELTPGSIIVNSANNKNYGTIVENKNNKIIVFRLEKDTYPVFSKIDYHPYIKKTGNINEFKNELLKSALLKYISTNNLTKNEESLLKNLLEFAFPLGIPEYRPDIELPERDQENLDLNSHLVIGKKLFINTPSSSPYRFLDNSTVDIVDKNEEGIWVIKPSTNNELETHFLFYKNREVPKFSGISRIVPLGVNSDYLDKYIETYQQKNNDNQLPTTMVYNGEKIKVMPSTRQVIFPIKYQHLKFEPIYSKFLNDKDYQKLSASLNNQNHYQNQNQNQNVLTDMNDYDFNFNNIKTKNKQEKGGLLMIGGSNEQDIKKELEAMDNMEMFNPSVDTINNITFEDAVQNTKHLIDEELMQLNNLSASITKIDDIDKNNKKDEENNTSDYESDNQSDIESEIDNIDEDDFEFVDDSEVIEGDIFQKIKRVEVADIEKVYKESIQRGDLFRYKLEEIPRLRRNDIKILNRIAKEINNISLLKHKITSEDNTIKFQSENYKPLIEKYTKKDFSSNQLLIPLVLNKKRIYLDTKGKTTKDDYDSKTHDVVENFYKDIEDLNTLVSKTSTNYDNYIKQTNEFNNPTQVDSSHNIGLLFKLGEGVSNDNINKLTQETLTIRHCDKEYSCQSYPVRTNNFDYQINLGPLGRYVDADEEVIDENIDIDELENKVDRNIEYTLGKFKINYNGDEINIIGFIRPPLSFFDKKLVDEDKSYNTLTELYKNCIDDELIEVINIDKINLDNDEQFNLFEHPDKFLCIMMEDSIIDNETFIENLHKVIPNIGQILELYNKDIYTIDDAYRIISKFEYDYNDLSINDREEIYKKINQETEDLLNHNKKIETKYKFYKRRQEKEKENENKNKSSEFNENDILLSNTELIDDLLNYYYDKYIDLKTKFDTDISRINWFFSQIDNGVFFMKNILLSYYNKNLEDKNVEELSAQLQLLKEEKDKLTEKRDIESSTQNIETRDKVNKCVVRKLNKPKIIKYPSIKRLEEDNQKVISDTDGEMVMPGDYAIIKEDTNIDLYKRLGLQDGDIWVKEDISTLQRLIYESKNACDSKLSEFDTGDLCLFDENNFECSPVEIVKIDNSIEDITHRINDVQQQIDYIKSLPSIVSNIKKEIKVVKDVLLNKYNGDQDYWKNKAIVSKEEEIEIAKTIYRPKDCIHFNVTDYFHNIPAMDTVLEEKFVLAKSIIDRFANNEQMDTLDIGEVQEEDIDNWTNCIICNQKLLCKHFLYGVDVSKYDRDFDFDEFINIFGVENGESYYCKICGEHLGNSQSQEFDEFGEGEDGKRIVSREIVESTPLLKIQRNQLDNRIDELIKDNEVGEHFELGISIYKLLKNLIGNSELRIEDEKEMINFLQHFEFVKKSFIKNNVIKKYGAKIKNKMILMKLINKYYNVYFISDIAARFLIVLQTSDYLYNINNKMVKCNYMGYPTINDTSSKDGVQLMISLLQQIGSLEKYSYLIDKDVNIESKIMERLKFQVDNSEYLRNKILNAVLDKVENIDNLYTFNNHITNYWVDYRPSLNIGVNWSPEKIIGESSLKDLKLTNYDKMIDVTEENNIHAIYTLMKYINNIVNEENITTELTRRTSLGNSCCKTLVDKNNKYLTYFYKKNADIKTTIEKINKLEEISKILKKKINTKIYQILFVPIINIALKELKLSLEPNHEEIKELFMKYIHKGVHIGEEHVYNSYGICIISGMTKDEKDDAYFDMNQFVNLYNIIKRKNQIGIDKDIETDSLKDRETDNEIQEDEVQTGDIVKTVVINKEFKSISIKDYEDNMLRVLEDEYILLNNIIDLLPKNENYNFLFNYLQIMINRGFIEEANNFNVEYILDKINKFRDENDIKHSKNKNILEDNSINNETKKNKNKNDKFDINKHLALISSQINNDIESLLNKLNLSKKERNFFEGKLNNIGDYIELSNEYRDKLNKNYESENNIKIDNHRYKLKEQGIQKDIKYLNDILNQIKNGKLDNIEDKSEVRPNYREFIKYSKNKKLIKNIKDEILVLTKLSKMLISREQFKMLFPENVANILHYIIIFALNSMYDYVYDSGIKDKMGKIKEIIGEGEEDEEDSDLMKESEILREKIDINYEEDEDMDEDEFKIQKSNNLNIVAELIETYLKKVFVNQEIYDTLTNDYITDVLARHQQKQQERNLKTFEFLSKEGMEEDYVMLMNKMAIGKLGYKELPEYMSQVYGEVLYDETNIDGDDVMYEDEGQMAYDDPETIEQENTIEQGEYERNVNQLGLDNYEMGEIAYVGDADEGMEEQDYAYMMVDDS